MIRHEIVELIQNIDHLLQSIMEHVTSIVSLEALRTYLRKVYTTLQNFYYASHLEPSLRTVCAYEKHAPIIDTYSQMILCYIVWDVCFKS